VTEGPCALQMLPLVAMVTWPHTRVLWRDDVGKISNQQCNKPHSKTWTSFH